MYYKLFHCLRLKKYSIYNVRSQLHNCQKSYVSNYFYCCIRLEGPSCDAERNLLAIAKFLVVTCYYRLLFHFLTCRLRHVNCSYVFMFALAI